MPSLSRTARHFFPPASRVKVTPETLLAPAPLPPMATPSPPSPVTWSDEALNVPAPATMSAADSEPPVDSAAGVAGPAVVGDVVAVGCGAAAVCGAGVELPVAGDVCDTVVVPAVSGAVVLVVAGVTAAAATVVGGVGVMDWRTASDGLEPPPPLTGTVVVGAGWTAVLVAGAAVVGGVVGATVVGTLLATVLLLLAVPWDWVPVAPEGAGAA
jgi:hypothetical protein